MNIEIQVLSHEPDRELSCFYRDYEINISRDDEQWTFGNWYANVRNEEGEVVFDGWIDDSSSLSLQAAFNFACSGSELELPEVWPDL